MSDSAIMCSPGAELLCFLIQLPAGEKLPALVPGGVLPGIPSSGLRPGPLTPLPIQLPVNWNGLGKAVRGWPITQRCLGKTKYPGVGETTQAEAKKIALTVTTTHGEYP